MIFFYSTHLRRAKLDTSAARESNHDLIHPQENS